MDDFLVINAKGSEHFDCLIRIRGPYASPRVTVSVCLCVSPNTFWSIKSLENEKIRILQCNIPSKLLLIGLCDFI